MRYTNETEHSTERKCLSASECWRFVVHQYRQFQVSDHLLPELPPDMTEPLHTIKAHGLQPSITQHLDDLCIFYGGTGQSGLPPAVYHRVGKCNEGGVTFLTLSILFKDQLSLLRLIFVFTTSSVLTSLTCMEKGKEQ